MAFPYDIPLAFDNGTNLANLKNWAVTADGVVKPGWKLVAGESSVSVHQTGTVISLR